MKKTILTILLIITASYLYSQNTPSTSDSLIEEYCTKTQENYSDIYKCYQNIYDSSVLSPNSKKELYNHFTHNVSESLIRLARVPEFKKITFETDPYSNDDLYRVFYSIVDMDLLVISIIADECDKHDKKLADRCLQAFKSRTLLLIDNYPITSNPTRLDKIVFAVCLRYLYKVNGLEDFVKEELKWRLKTLQRRKCTEDVLFPILAIQFALGDASVLDVNKLSKDEKFILRAFIYDNPKIKISKPDLEKIGKFGI